MKQARLVALALIPLIAGCDIAVGAYLATRKKSSSSRSAAAVGPDVRFSVWVADLSGTTGAAEQGVIAGAAGNPGPNWILLASGTSTMELTMPAGNFDSVLIQATDAQIYHIDAIEVLDSTGTTTATAASGNLFEDLVNNIPNMSGPPDAVIADTAATAANKAFVFLRHPSFITTPFRISIWQPTARAEGDLEWSTTYAFPGNQLAGGAAVNSAGTTHLTLRESGSIFLLRIGGANGAVIQDSGSNDFSTVATPVSTALGHSSVAIDQTNDDVFVASTIGAGDIRLQKWVGTSAAAAWTFPAVAGAGVDRVEPNGLALNSNGDLILAAGFDQQGLVGVQHYVRKHSRVNGSDMWIGSPPPGPPADTTGTYWYAVAARGTADIFATGNLAQGLGLGPVDIYTQRLLDNSPVSVTESWNNPFNNGGQNPGLGQSVGVDASGNVFVAGSLTNTGLNSVILRYASGVPPASLHLNSSRTGNDEILDIAVESDGTLYAVGYETNAGQGQDLVLLKIAPNNAILWKRTVHNGVGDDRGVSVMLTPLHVIVVGELTVGASNKDIHVRKYVK